MNIGLALHTGFGTFESVKFVARTVFESLAVRHDVRQLPPAYDYSSPQEQERMARELVDGSDVLVGFYSVLEPLLAARHRSGRTVPCLVLVLGAFPRGALLLKRLLPYLTSSDFLVVNCAADAELARRFFAEPRVTVVPLAIDLDTYRPLPSGARGELRRRLKFDDASRVLVYAGRVTPEKGVHTTLRVFSAVNRLVPDSVLVVAGPVQNAPFAEVGVTPVNYGRTLALAAERLGLPAARVRFVGPIEPRHLHLLYTAADVAVNMTLHHDENFGLAQVEASACGLPVVGTAWGGLRDTIRDGVNGHKVGTVVTPLGVKVVWWEAVNKCLLVLRGEPACNRISDDSVRHVREYYSPARFRARLEHALAAAAALRDAPAGPLAATPFASRFWSACADGSSSAPRYVPDTGSFALYQDLVASYSGAGSGAVPLGRALAPDEVLSLAAPVAEVCEGVLRVDDPLYPFDCEVPGPCRPGVAALAAAMAREPAITVGRLTRVYLSDGAAHPALDWALSRGIVLRSAPADGWVSPEMIDPSVGRPLFRTHRLGSQDLDFVVA